MRHVLVPKQTPAGMTTCHRLRKRVLSIFLCIGAFTLTACVSSTLGTVDTQPEPQPLAAEPAHYDPQQRDQAVAEIRAKASQPSGELTNAFAEAEGEGELMSPDAKNRTINELETGIAQENETIPDAELSASQRSIREMQRKAKSHYDSAVTEIKN